MARAWETASHSTRTLRSAADGIWTGDWKMKPGQVFGPYVGLRILLRRTTHGATVFSLSIMLQALRAGDTAGEGERRAVTGHG